MTDHSETSNIYGNHLAEAGSVRNYIRRACGMDGPNREHFATVETEFSTQRLPMTRFVSLGGDCQVTHHLKRLSLESDGYFFDWITSPCNSITTLIETNFEPLLQAEDLEPDYKDGKLVKVIDRRHNLWFVHDFQSFDDDNIANVQSKYRYKSARFLHMLNDGLPATFIRRWQELMDGPADEADARRLLATIKKFKPDAKMIFLHQRKEQEAIIEDDYRSAFILQSPPDWRGDEAAWTHTLMTFSGMD